MTKKCIMEAMRGIRIFGRVINPNVEIDLSTREIFEIVRMSGIKLYEIVGDKKVRLDITNYKIANVTEAAKVEPVKVVVPEEKTKVEPVQEKEPVVTTIVNTTVSEDDYVGAEDAEEAEGVVEPKEADIPDPEVEDSYEEESVEESSEEEVIVEETPVEEADEEVEEAASQNIQQREPRTNNFNKYGKNNNRR